MRRYSCCIAAAILVSSVHAWPAHASTQIVVESMCASGTAYVESGTGWANSTAKSNRTACGGGSRSTKDAAAYADFIPAIVTDGARLLRRSGDDPGLDVGDLHALLLCRHPRRSDCPGRRP